MEKQYTEKIQEITINMQTNAMKYKIAILEKNRKKEPSSFEFLCGRDTNYKYYFRIKKRNMDR
jgi:hypothetical protein